MVSPSSLSETFAVTRAGSDDVLAGLRPYPKRRLPPASLPVMVRTSPLLRGFLPRGAAVAWAERRARRAWAHDPAVRSRSLAAMAAIVANTEREPELEALAQDHFVEERVRDELLWRPWRDPEIEAASMRHVRAAFDAGRPVLISGNHQAPLFTGMFALRRIVPVIHVVAAPWMSADPTPGYWGRYVARWQQGARRGGLLVVETGPATVIQLRVLLDRGAAVLVVSDMPGKLETPFLGKPVMLSPGTARLAKLGNALVLPQRCRREGSRVFADFAAPIDAAAYATVGELHRAIFAVHERWILDTPHALEDPRRAGAWEDGATPTAWRRPRSR